MLDGDHSGAVAYYFEKKYAKSIDTDCGES